MKKFCIFVILLVITTLSWGGEIGRIQAKGEITVSLNRGYPPFAMEKDGKIFGLDVDLAHLLADSPFVQVWRNTHLEHYQKIAALLTPVTREYYAFAVRPGDPAFLNWLNLFIDQIKIDGTLDLLTYEYFEQMSWAQQKSAPEKRLNRAQLLKGKFWLRLNKEIEDRPVPHYFLCIYYQDSTRGV